MLTGDDISGFAISKLFIYPVEFIEIENVAFYLAALYKKECYAIHEFHFFFSVLNGDPLRIDCLNPFFLEGAGLEMTAYSNSPVLIFMPHPCILSASLSVNFLDFD